MIPYCILVIDDEDDRAFMTELFLSYNHLMYREIFQIVHNKWVTEDLIQDVLIKLIDQVKELRSKDRNRLVNYIISASRNRAKNYLRDQHPAFSFDDQIDCPDPLHNREQIEHRLIHTHDLDSLARVWPKLDKRSQYLLEGYYILEKTTAEMARDLGIKTDSVRMALVRARKAAYELLKEETNAKV